MDPSSSNEEFLILDFVSSQPVEEEVIEDGHELQSVVNSQQNSSTQATEQEVEVSLSLLDTMLFSNSDGQRVDEKAGTPSEFSQVGVEMSDGRVIPPGRSRAAVTRCLEPDCNFQCSRIPRLRSHLEESHGIVQEMKEFAFDTESNFKDWLSQLEQEARCAFMRRRGWQKNKSGSLTACYYCNRGGLYVSSATKKQGKTQGSCKTGVECTASMKVTKWPVKDGNAVATQPLIEVEAYLQHYGHNLDLSHIRITKAQKREIASKLSQGISKYKILDEIRGSLDPTTTPQRVHLLSLQDMYNIERKEGIQGKKGKLSCEPGTTVQAWIEKMQKSEDNPVLLIKYQQEKATQMCACLSNDDFLLVLQTSLQSMMLRRYGPHQCVCMDITQGQFPSANPSRADPNFHLMALEVLIPNSTGLDEVLPVAWFVSNRKDKPVIDICLTQIRNNLSDLVLTPSYLITPTADMTAGCDWLEVWNSIFGSGPRRIIGGWNIVGEWHRLVYDPALNSAARPLEAKRLVANLNLVMRETVPANFVSLMKEFLDDLASNVLTKRFGEHFKRHYVKQPELWSRAYRSEALNRAESRFDVYHQKLSKNIYHEGFKRKQLDVLIKTLMKHSRDKAMTKLRQSFRTMSDGVLKRMTSTKHEEGMSLPIDFVKPRQDGRSWSVISVIDKVRAIEKPQLQGDPVRLTQVAVERIVTCDGDGNCMARLRCPYRCIECEVCSHQFSCTCNEQPADACSVTSVLCEHCHLVCRYLTENGRKVSSLFVSPDVTFSELPSENPEHSKNPNQTAPLVVYVTADNVDQVTVKVESEDDLPCLRPKRSGDSIERDEAKRTKQAKAD